jgi:hypothetical protein
MNIVGIDSLNYGPNDFVWYVCYGSNLNFKRFMCYLTGDDFQIDGITILGKDRCNNANEPLEKKKVYLPFRMYFGRASQRWGGSSVAFLDLTNIDHSPVRWDPSDKNSPTIGKAYKITYEQLCHVRKGEGTVWYDALVYLGDLDGIPAFTLTSSEGAKGQTPGQAYQDTIIEGLTEFDFGESLSKKEAAKYIKSFF